MASPTFRAQARSLLMAYAEAHGGGDESGVEELGVGEWFDS